MHNYLGISEPALAWFGSYIYDSTQSIRIRTDASEEHPVRYRVPQGPVLGPLFFSVYSTSVRHTNEEFCGLSSEAFCGLSP